MEKKRTFGGAQPGAGRKATGITQTARNTKFDDELFDRLKEEKNFNRTVNKAVRDYYARLDAIEKNAQNFEEID